MVSGYALPGEVGGDLTDGARAFPSVDEDDGPPPTGTTSPPPRRRGAAARRGTPGRDLEPYVDEDRRHRRFRQHADGTDSTPPTARARSPDRWRACSRRARPCLVRGMADVSAFLHDGRRRSGPHRRPRLGQQSRRARYSSPRPQPIPCCRCRRSSSPARTAARSRGKGSVASRASAHASVGQGTASASVPRRPRVGAATAQPVRPRVPAATAASAPRHPERHANAAQQREEQHAEGDQPTSGSRWELQRGQERDEQGSPRPAIEPSNAARGRRAGPVASKARNALTTPIASVVAMPTFQARTDRRWPASPARGTPNAIAEQRRRIDAERHGGTRSRGRCGA